MPLLEASPILDQLFGSAARVAVLKALLLDPGRPYYQRQLESATHTPLRGVQRELDRLTALGLLFRRKEGNRVYFQVNRGHPLFPDLRAILLKEGSRIDRLRGALTQDDAVRLALLSEDAAKVLIVLQSGRRLAAAIPTDLESEIINDEEFLQLLQGSSDRVAPYLARGVDVLGRRDDVLWRHIEAAGYSVAKGAGVP
jgi:hypothetical protein